MLALAPTALVVLSACGEGSNEARPSQQDYAAALLEAKAQADEQFLEYFRQNCRLEIEVLEELLGDVDDLVGHSSAIQALHEEWVLAIEEDLLARKKWCESLDERETWSKSWETGPYSTDEYANLDEAIQRRADACDALAEALGEERLCD